MTGHDLLYAVGDARPEWLEACERRNRRKPIRASLYAAAALVLFLLAAGGAAVLAGARRGQFVDIFRWDRAVVGTAYECAEGEITLTPAYEDGVLAVELSFADPELLPFREIETVRLSGCRIEGGDGSVRSLEELSAAAEVKDGRALLLLPVQGLPAGRYRFAAETLEGGKKADAPLIIRGSWEADFTVPDAGR